MAKAIINNRQVRNKKLYELNPNTREGFSYSVETSQTMIALQYAEVLIEELTSRVKALEEKLLEQNKPNTTATVKKPRTVKADPNTLTTED